MLVAQLLRECRFFALQGGELGLELLNHRIVQHDRQGVRARGVVAQRRELPVQRFGVDPLRLGAGRGAAQFGQALGDDVLLLRKRDVGVLLAVLLQRHLACPHLRPLFGQPGVQPVGRFLRRVQLDVEVLLDVGVRQRVGDVGGDLTIGRFESDVNQAVVGAVRNGDPLQKGIDHA